jgi:hypothetical protein
MTFLARFGRLTTAMRSASAARPAAQKSSFTGVSRTGAAKVGAAMPSNNTAVRKRIVNLPSPQLTAA